jgi:hypothetical protein
VERALEQVDGVGDPGAVLAVDVIDANPQAHASPSVNVTFHPCTVWDNTLSCREEREAAKREALATVSELLARVRKRTDVAGGLAVAALFFGAHGAGERYLEVLSDMVQVARGIRLDRRRDGAGTPRPSSGGSPGSTSRGCGCTWRGRVPRAGPSPRP